MSAVEAIGKGLEFAGPIIAEGIALLGKYIAASKEEKAALILRRDAALAEMRAERVAEEKQHETLTAETQRIIDEAARAVGHKEPSPVRLVERLSSEPDDK